MRRGELTAITVAMFEGRSEILVAGTRLKVCSVELGHLLVHVGHDLRRQVETVDDLVLPLVDQHTVLHA